MKREQAAKLAQRLVVLMSLTLSAEALKVVEQQIDESLLSYLSVLLSTAVLGLNYFLFVTHHSKSLLDLATKLLPRKVGVEFLGDEYEMIERRDAAGMPRWLNELHTLSAIAWAVFYTLKELCDPMTIWKMFK